MKQTFVFTVLLILAAALTGCGNDMRDQPYYRPLDKSHFFKDGRSARPIVEGTVAQGFLKEDTHLYEGKINGDFAQEFPFPITRQVLLRGQERFNIFCAVCHDRVGSGRGMVVRRGFPQAASFHEPRLREAAPGYLFDVITHGFGNMPAYAAQIPEEDRWAIVAYLRVLQFSQNADLGTAPIEVQQKLLQES